MCRGTFAGTSSEPRGVYCGTSSLDRRGTSHIGSAGVTELALAALVVIEEIVAGSLEPGAGDVLLWSPDVQRTRELANA